MSIKQNGGVFGRNPTFNDVTIEGDLIINGEVFTGLDFQGSWNASTNSPTLASSVGTNGEFYIVSVAGTTDLNGITNWGIGDWALFNGTVWQRVEGGADGNFNDLTANSLNVNGTATVDGLTSVLGSDAQGKFSGWSPTGSTATSSGAIEIGQTDAYQAIIAYDAASNTRFIFDNTYGSATSTFEFRTNTAATAKTHLKIEGSGDISFYEDTGTTAKFFWDASAESLGIGTSSPSAAAILDVQSTTKGVRFPNMTTTQKNAMADVAGVQVFDTTLGKMCFNTGSAWETITSS